MRNNTLGVGNLHSITLSNTVFAGRTFCSCFEGIDINSGGQNLGAIPEPFAAASGLGMVALGVILCLRRRVRHRSVGWFLQPARAGMVPFRFIACAGVPLGTRRPSLPGCELAPVPAAQRFVSMYSNVRARSSPITSCHCGSSIKLCSSSGSSAVRKNSSWILSAGVPPWA